MEERKWERKETFKAGSKLCQFAFFVFERHFITYLNMFGFCFQLSVLLFLRNALHQLQSRSTGAIAHTGSVHAFRFLSPSQICFSFLWSECWYSCLRPLWSAMCQKWTLVWTWACSRSDTLIRWNVLQRLWSSAWALLVFPPSSFSAAKTLISSLRWISMHQYPRTRFL